MSANLMSLARSGGKFLKLFGDRKMVKTMPTARDYVQDGLVAMWDGEWNAGDGIRNVFLPVIKDITGSGRDLIFGNIEYDFGDKFIHFILPSGSEITVRTPEFENYVTGTLEVVYRKKNYYSISSILVE